jgi:ribosome-associated protein
MDSRKLARLCRDLADNKKADNLVVLDVRKVTSIADYFVLATGMSEPHLRAIMDEITDRLRQDHNLRPRAIDGAMPTHWIVLDYNDVIIHLMRSDVREHYAIEALWGDAPRLRGKRRSTKSSLLDTPFLRSS